MSGKRYVCRVVREFGSLGPSGLVEHKIGDELVRDTEPADASHMEVVRVEGDSEPQAAHLVVNPASEGEAVEAAAVAGSGDAPAAEAEAQAAPADAAPAEAAATTTTTTAARKRAQAAAG